MWHILHTRHITCYYLYQYMTVWYKFLLGDWNRFITTYGIIVSLLLFIFFSCCFYAFKIRNINIYKPTLHGMYPYMTPQTQKNVVIEGHLISNLWTVQSWSFAVLLLQLWWFPPHEMLDGWLILALYVLLYIIRERSISTPPIWGFFFFIFLFFS